MIPDFKPPPRPLDPRIPIGILVGLGLVFALRAVQVSRDTQEQARWSTAAGVIEYVHISPRPTARGCYFVPVLRYSYFVGGRTYDGNKLTLHEPYPRSRGELERRLLPYPVSAAVMVYYDPTNPQRAVLEADRSSMIPTLLKGAAVAGLAAVIGWTLSRKTKRPDQRLKLASAAK